MNMHAWLELMKYFGFEENLKEYQKIVAYYSERHRAYHNISHIQDCLDKCNLNEETKNNKELKLAFWYHDIIYYPYNKHNELKSTEIAIEFLKQQTSDEKLPEQIKNLIMATLHNQHPSNIDEAYIMDIDITILGTSEKTYKAYTKNIRKEYKLIP